MFNLFFPILKYKINISNKQPFFFIFLKIFIFVQFQKGLSGGAGFRTPVQLAAY
jgi:hypothetical protein